MEDRPHRSSERKHRPSTRNHNDRSRSPYRASHHERSHKRQRTESPKPPPKTAPKILPFRQQPLSKHDFDKFKQLFGLYLDVQKSLGVDELEEREVRGRWKSFVKKWNLGELAEGWYEPATKKRADENAEFGGVKDSKKQGVRGKEGAEKQTAGQKAEREEDSDDDFGPALPAQRGGERTGPKLPTMEELQLVEEMRAEDVALAKSDMVYSRKRERKTQKELLEELVPRSDAGTRERQLEKKAEIGASVAAFRDAKEGGEAELPEGDVMGDDGIEGLKKRKTEMERKKNEKELRREEQLRARMAEREERMKALKEKEDKTMDYLKQLVKERYG